MIYLGAFAEKNAFEDMVIVLFFGGLGWVMEKLEWPRPPVLLGLVLGPLAENRLFLSTDNYGAGVACTVRASSRLFAFTLFGIFYPMIKNRREEKEKLRFRTQDQALLKPAHPGICASATKRLFSIVVIVLLALALWQSRNFGYRAGLFPWVIGIPTLILALLSLPGISTGKEKPKGGSGRIGEIQVDIAPEAGPSKRTISILLWTVGFFVAIWLLGFSYAVPLTIFCI